MCSEKDKDIIYHALAHEIRRKVIKLVREKPGMPVGELSEEFGVSRIAVLGHLTVLERAGMISSDRDGRLRRLYFNSMPTEMIYHHWAEDYSVTYSEQVA